MTCGTSLSYIIKCEAQHFVLSACVGLLAYWLMQTTLSHTKYLEQKNTQTNTTADSFISHLPLRVAVCCSILAHVIEDYTVSWF